MAHKMRLVEQEKAEDIAAPPENLEGKKAASAKEELKRAAKGLSESEIGKSVQAGIGTLSNVLSSREAKVTAGVVGVGLGALIAASVIGAGELAVAGAAGYLAYRRLTRRDDKEKSS